jgi:hypothetical protein
MSIDAIRFRATADAVVLQVLESREGRYDYERKGEWRDAKVEDLLEVARYTRAYDALDQSISQIKADLEAMRRQDGNYGPQPEEFGLR